MNDTSKTELDLLVTLFETGKELSKQYEQYDGDKDWVEWLSDVLPRADVYPLLEAYAAQREQAAVRKQVEIWAAEVDKEYDWSEVDNWIFALGDTERNHYIATKPEKGTS